MLEAELAGGTDAVSGEVAFRLHDTHGFPVELTREIAAERGAGVDERGFEKAMDRQRAMSKQAGSGRTSGSEDLLELYRSLLEQSGPTRFLGYSQESATSTVLAAAERQDAQWEVFLDATAFYAESGGQVGDTGVIETDTGRARVLDTTFALPGLIRHLAVIEEGDIRPGQVAASAVDARRRAAIRRNHTATHLLHWALRSVLGDHVKQQGSLVAADRLRFDFTHYGPVAEADIESIEDLVNAEILRDEDVSVDVMAKRDADAAGAIAFFEDKYGDEVRVVRAGSESMELCGGTHVARLGQIGPVSIISEGSIGSNLRRVEATTGTVTLARMRRDQHEIAAAAGLLRARPEELAEALERKLGEQRELESRVRAAQQASLAGQARSLAELASDGKVVARVDGLAQDQMRELAALVRQNDGIDTVVLGGSPDGAKAALVAVVAKDTSPSAPELISDAARLVGGGGGGRNPEQASAGGQRARAGSTKRSSTYGASSPDDSRKAVRAGSRLEAHRRRGLGLGPEGGHRSHVHTAGLQPRGGPSRDRPVRRRVRRGGRDRGAPAVALGRQRRSSAGGARGGRRASPRAERGGRHIRRTVDHRERVPSGLRAGGRSARRQRGVIDQTAAAILLQDWMGRNPPEGDC